MKNDTTRERDAISSPKRLLIDVLRELERKAPAKAKKLEAIIGKLENLQSTL